MFSFLRKEPHKKVFELISRDSKVLIKLLNVPERDRHYSELEAFLLFYIETLRSFSMKKIPTEMGHKLYYLMREKFAPNDIELKIRKEGFENIDHFLAERKRFYFEETKALSTFEVKGNEANFQGPIIKLYHFLNCSPFTKKTPWELLLEGKLLAMLYTPMETLPFYVAINSTLISFYKDLDSII